MQKFIILLCTIIAVCHGQKTYLLADGDSPGTYSLLNRVLGGTAYEVPDCIHPIQHITQQTDAGNVDSMKIFPYKFSYFDAYIIAIGVYSFVH